MTLYHLHILLVEPTFKMAGEPLPPPQKEKEAKVIAVSYLPKWWFQLLNGGFSS